MTLKQAHATGPTVETAVSAPFSQRVLEKPPPPPPIYFYLRIYEMANNTKYIKWGMQLKGPALPSMLLYPSVCRLENFKCWLKKNASAPPQPAPPLQQNPREWGSRVRLLCSPEAPWGCRHPPAERGFGAPAPLGSGHLSSENKQFRVDGRWGRVPSPSRRADQRVSDGGVRGGQALPEPHQAQPGRGQPALPAQSGVLLLAHQERMVRHQHFRVLSLGFH